MRKLFLLAAALSVCGAVSPGSFVDPNHNTMVTVLDYEWPQARSRVSSLCVGNSKCIGWCGYGLFDGGCSIDCIGNDGGSLGVTIGDAGSGQCTPSFIPGVLAMDIKAATQSPYVTSSSLDFPMRSGNPGTMFAVGMGRGDAGSVPPNALNFWQDDWTDPHSANAYFEFYFDPRNAAGGGVGWWQPPITEGLTQASEQLVNFYGIANASFEGPAWDGGAKNCVAGVGLVQEFVSDPGRIATTGAGNKHQFGANTIGSQYLNGPDMLHGYYNAQLTAAETREVQDTIWGVFNDAGTLTPKVDFTAAPRGEAIDHSGDGGNVDLMWSLLPLTDGTGALRSHRAYQNFWADDPLQVSGWTGVNSPAVSTDTLAGPFDYYRGTVSGDEIIDDSSSFEGYRSPLGTTDDGGLHWWSASCIMRAGTNDGGTPTISKARLAFTSTSGTIDGGNATCDFTGLTTNWTRNECRASYYGGTNMKADVLVGNAATDQGSIGVAQCQLAQTNALNPPVPWSTPRPQYWHELSTANWPSAADGGSFEFVHRALFDPVEQGLPDGGASADPKDTYDYIIDNFLQSTSDHCLAFIFGELSTADLFVAIRDGHGVNSDLTPAVGRLVVGQMYATKAEWYPVGGGKCNLYVYHNTCSGSSTSCFATVPVASDVTGTATCPCTPEKSYIGNRLSGDFGTETEVLAVRVGFLRR